MAEMQGCVCDGRDAGLCVCVCVMAELKSCVCDGRDAGLCVYDGRDAGLHM